MTNEIIILLSIIILFSTNILFFKLWGKTGLCLWTCLATITANIEVLILVDAFTLEQTLGNILFATTFLSTDIASEIYGKKTANQIVNVGIATSIVFMLISQSWMLYQPSPNDTIFPHMQAVFSNTPRLIFVGLLVYAICQRFDVWMYDKWWTFTKNHFHDSHRFLWLRNNGSTLISQLLNSLFFTYGAFYGVFDNASLLSIFKASYLIFLVLSLADTFFVYWARSLYEKNKVKEL